MSLLSGCMGMGRPSDKDPLFYYNRMVFYINQDVDRVLIRPVTKVYVTLAPDWFQKCIHNAFSNLDDINVIANDILQFAFYDTWRDTRRLLINTTLGIGGLFDVASHYHLSKHHNDFGLTLAHWGYQNSTFIVLPLVGPRTVRDSFGLVADYGLLTVWPYIDPGHTRNNLLAATMIDKRRELLSKDALIRRAFDPYVFVRNAYLKSRKQSIEEERIRKKL